MRKNGWIKLWRQFASTPMWLAEPFTRAQAWMDLQMMACYLDEGNQHPGDVFCSLRYLARRWQWSRDKVSRFLQWLDQAEWITLNPDQPEDQPGDRPLLRLEFYGFDQLSQPLFRPEDQPPEPSNRPENQPGNQPDIQPPSGLENTGRMASPPPENRPLPRPKTGHNKEEEYRSILFRGAKAPGIEEKEVPSEYRDRFPTWEEYAAWRYQ